MSSKYAVLPCNGLDKCAGQITKEIALAICEKTESDLICPVLYQVAESKYDTSVKENPLLVIDGCGMRCASKLAAAKNLKIQKKMTVSAEAKERGCVLPTDTLRLSEAERKLAVELAAELSKETETAKEDSGAETVYQTPNDFAVYTRDKFIFRVPTEGFYFTENDCWLQVSGNRARIGVTDYVQQSLSDIMFFTPPNLDSELEQFDEAGVIESGKAVFEVICPVSGKVVAVNAELASAPEFINQSPYEKGWIAELELTNFAEEVDFLLTTEGYMKILKKKVDDFHVK
ncbi:glycine cleavage system protein GcvH [Azotosporobacter soli]|uniref:glycine cleavage system protein GcvH n=1 Tax=Azotosporobacter soli TaxID=3055040 RepID=UPI0031FED807